MISAVIVPRSIEPPYGLKATCGDRHAQWRKEFQEPGCDDTDPGHTSRSNQLMNPARGLSLGWRTKPISCLKWSGALSRSH